MIVTTGQIIKVDAVGFRFERNSETPGLVTVIHNRTGARFELPAHTGEVAAFCAAYSRTASASIPYRSSEVE